ncbi:hypothetical protein GCM10020366_71030 [Saccharopolyspora gregorii]|uniref:Uncharacterized protein n=1 Tax=Saccharopolyspora gregorii TaxID=33914 RepID=A0ABP6S2V4_9PSEU
MRAHDLEAQQRPASARGPARFQFLGRAAVVAQVRFGQVDAARAVVFEHVLAVLQDLQRGADAVGEGDQVGTGAAKTCSTDSPTGFAESAQ